MPQTAREKLLALSSGIEWLLKRNEWLELIAGEMLDSIGYELLHQSMLPATPAVKARLEILLARWRNALKEDQPK